MEYKIDEKFKYNGKVYIVKEEMFCMGCAFENDEDGCFFAGACHRTGREDETSVIFVEVK